jgi:tripartite-type tricarboxylate transporter receptor subunit TctC
MKRSSPIGALLGVVAVTLLSGIAGAQEQFPTRTVNFVVPASPGGPSDVIARLVAEPLQKVLGQPVIVVNKPGASLTLGTSFVAKSEPDGHTLLFTTSTPIVMTPYTMKNVPYDVQKDLVTVSRVGTVPLVLYVSTSTPVSNIKELIEYVTANPARAVYGTYGTGSSAHVLMELLISQTKMKMVHVPYKGVTPELQDLISGQILTAVADIGVAQPFVNSGHIRPIAVTGAERSKHVPDVPTFAEQGIAGAEPFSPWWGVFAPSKTPPQVVDRLSAEIFKIVTTPDFRTKLAAFGIEPTGVLSAEANALTAKDMAKWKEIISSLPDLKFE